MREKLVHLLSQDSFVSGEQLAEKLKISRTAVWKQIKKLKELGYKIESTKNKGYRLLSKPDVPIPEEVSYKLNTKIIGSKIHHFKTIDSTNTYAKKLVKNGAEEGTIVVSDVQLSGRGRKNRTWSSPEGGLWFSVILYPNIPPQNGMLITMTSSVAIAEAINEVTGIKPVIKWPNDLLINNRKICGILTELDAEMDKINYLVVGIGINVNNKLDEELKEIGTSLIEQVGSNVSRVKLLQSILQHFDEIYEKISDGNYEFVRDLWFSYSNIIGKNVKIHQEENDITGVVSGLDDTGCLLLETDAGLVKVLSGDLEFL